MKGICAVNSKNIEKILAGLPTFVRIVTVSYFRKLESKRRFENDEKKLR